MAHAKVGETLVGEAHHRSGVELLGLAHSCLRDVVIRLSHFLKILQSPLLEVLLALHMGLVDRDD